MPVIKDPDSKAAVHLADPSRESGPYGPYAYCRFIKNRQITTNIDEVTCLHCIKKFKGMPHLDRKVERTAWSDS
jgi:hypothetical protein